MRGKESPKRGYWANGARSPGGGLIGSSPHEWGAVAAVFLRIAARGSAWRVRKSPVRPSAGGQPANGRRETGDERREVPIALPGRGEVRTRRSLRRVRGRLRAGSCARPWRGALRRQRRPSSCAEALLLWGDSRLAPLAGRRPLPPRHQRNLLSSAEARAYVPNEGWPRGVRGGVASGTAGRGRRSEGPGGLVLCCAVLSRPARWVGLLLALCASSPPRALRCVERAWSLLWAQRAALRAWRRRCHSSELLSRNSQQLRFLVNSAFLRCYRVIFCSGITT